MSIFQRKKLSNVLRDQKKNARTGVNRDMLLIKGYRNFKGRHRYSLQHGREANKHRDKSKTDSRNNVMSSSVQVIFEHDEDLSSEDSSDAEYMYDNFEDHEIDSDDEEKQAKRTEDGQEISRCTNEITVYVTVDDHPDGPMHQYLCIAVTEKIHLNGYLLSPCHILRYQKRFHVKRGSYMPLVVEVTLQSGLPLDTSPPK